MGKGRVRIFADSNERSKTFQWCQRRGLNFNDMEVKLRIRDEIRTKISNEHQQSPDHEYYFDNPQSQKRQVAQAEARIKGTAENLTSHGAKSLKAQIGKEKSIFNIDSFLAERAAIHENEDIILEEEGFTCENSLIKKNLPGEPEDPLPENSRGDPPVTGTSEILPIPTKKINRAIKPKLPQNSQHLPKPKQQSRWGRTSNTPTPYATKMIWNGEHYDPDKGRFLRKKGEWYNPISKSWQIGLAPWEIDPRTKYFYWYHEFILNDQNYYHPDPMGQCHLEWCVQMESGVQKLVMLCPRDHFKTSFCNIGYILFHICERQDLAQQGILNISWDDELALTTYFSIKQNLTENERMIKFYGYLVDEFRPSTQNKLYFIFQPSGAKPGLFCASFKAGRITGTHPFLVFLDDIQDEIFTPPFMRRFRQIIQRKIFPALGKVGRFFVTGTIKGFDEKNDGYLWLETIPSIKVLRYPAANEMPPMEDVVYELKYHPVLDAAGLPKFDGKGKPIFIEQFVVTVKDRAKYTTLYPERYSIEDFVAKRLEMADKGDESDDVFWSEYFLRATNPEGRFFLKKRIGSFPPPNHANTQAFISWLKTFHQPVTLWVDPGGKGSHGCAIAVVAFVAGYYYVLDLVVVRAGLPKVAEVIGDLFLMYGVKVWGCEGNFDQAETYAATLDRELRAYLIKKGLQHLYVRCNALNNKGDKILRIQGTVTTMIGIDGTPIQFFVNPQARSIEQFRSEVAQFPDIKGDVKHEFDLLDAVASCRIHLAGKTQKAGILAGGLRV